MTPKLEKNSDTDSDHINSGDQELPTATNSGDQELPTAMDVDDSPVNNQYDSHDENNSNSLSNKPGTSKDDHYDPSMIDQDQYNGDNSVQNKTYTDKDTRKKSNSKSPRSKSVLADKEDDDSDINDNVMNPANVVDPELQLLPKAYLNPANVIPELQLISKSFLNTSKKKEKRTGIRKDYVEELKLLPKSYLNQVSLYSSVPN